MRLQRLILVVPLVRYISDPAGYPDASTSAMDVDYNDKVNIIDASFLQ